MCKNVIEAKVALLLKCWGDHYWSRTIISKLDMYMLVWFMVFNATLIKKKIQLYCGGRFYWWRKSEYPEKTTDLQQVAEKLYHMMLY